jgi:hypothetical protein
VDGLAGILVLLGLDLPCVVFPAHRPAELGGLVPVHLLAGELGGKGRLGGRGEGRGAGEEGSEDDELVLTVTIERETGDVRRETAPQESLNFRLAHAVLRCSPLSQRTHHVCSGRSRRCLTQGIVTAAQSAAAQTTKDPLRGSSLLSRACAFSFEVLLRPHVGRILSIHVEAWYVCTKETTQHVTPFVVGDTGVTCHMCLFVRLRM